MKIPETYPRSAVWLIPIARVLCTLFYGGLFRVRWTGIHRVPLNGPILLTPNHQSWLDPPMVGIPMTGRRFRVMAQQKYFDSPFLAWLMTALGAFPVDLSARMDRKAYQRCRNTLEQGLHLFLFPEGTRSKDGALGDFLPGAARLALQTGADLVPVAITGAYEAWPRSRKLPRLFGEPVRMKFYRPIPVEKIEDRSQLGARAKELTGQARRVIERRIRAHARWRRMRERRAERHDR